MQWVSTAEYRSFITQHVPELLVEIEDEPLGFLWITNDLIYGFGLPDPGDNDQTFLSWYRNGLALRLSLALLISRLSTHRQDSRLARAQASKLDRLLLAGHIDFEKRDLGGYLGVFRPMVSWRGEELLLEVLKRHVRLARHLADERTRVTHYQLHQHVLLLHVCAERLGLTSKTTPTPTNNPGDRNPFLVRQLECGMSRAVRLSDWPVSPNSRSTWFSEIRDPRFRRFRS
ncbi:hypothetical protein DM785_19150 (plasmid) [Deinococcus actinosclerus]|nr:hypothetical protein DM785_19150 [Deinococcus actinosclerus]